MLQRYLLSNSLRERACLEKVTCSSYIIESRGQVLAVARVSAEMFACGAARARVYVFYRSEDEVYALHIAKALRQYHAS
jgi:hypothetical protein